MFFGLFKKGSIFKSKDACTVFLEEADKALISALRISNAKGLDKYFARSCLGRVVEDVNSNKDNLCGIERYRVVNYTLHGKLGDDLVYIKSITYKNVDMGYGVSLSMGEAGNEYWFVRPRDNSYIITNIKGA